MGLDVLFGWILDKLEKAAPMAWVYPWQRSIRVFGKRYKEMGPGFHLKIPWAMVFEDEDVVWGKVECPKQRVCSQDGIAWFVTLTFDMRIINIVRAHVEREEHLNGVMTDAMAIVAEWVNSNLSEELSIEALKVDCSEEIKKKARTWGCATRNLGVEDFAPFDRVFCVVGRDDEAFPIE